MPKPKVDKYVTFFDYGPDTDLEIFENSIKASKSYNEKKKDKGSKGIGVYLAKIINESELEGS